MKNKSRLLSPVGISSSHVLQHCQSMSGNSRSSMADAVSKSCPGFPPTCPEPSTHVYGSLPLTDTHLLAEAFFCLEEPPHSIEQQIVSAVKVKACHAPPISSLGTFARCLSKGEKKGSFSWGLCPLVWQLSSFGLHLLTFFKMNSIKNALVSYIQKDLG